MKPFFLAVDGARGPKQPHETLESARAEAIRLFASDSHKAKHRVYILETAETIEPSIDPS